MIICLTYTAIGITMELHFKIQNPVVYAGVFFWAGFMSNIWLETK